MTKTKIDYEAPFEKVFAKMEEKYGYDFSTEVWTDDDITLIHAAIFATVYSLNTTNGNSL